MDLIKFFTSDEFIAGVDINDSALRLVLLDRKRNKEKTVYIKEVAEEPLEPGIIQAGILKDPAKFTAAFKNLLSKSKTKINYIILSLPQSLAYSRIFYFPKVIEGAKLEEAMRAETQFNLPVDTKHVYLDWEKTGTERNELYLTTIPKGVVDPYIAALNSLRIQIVAAESHLLSAIRSSDIEHSKPIALIIPEANDTLVAIVKNRSIRFTRLLQKNISEKEMKEEIDRVSTYYEAEDEPISKVIKFESVGMVKKFADYGQIKDNSASWLVAVGAGLRGLLPRKADNLVSLLPMGTEESYEYQKSVIFTKFVSSVVVGLSIVFAVSFAGSWVLVNYLQISLGSRIINLTLEAIPPDTAASEKRVMDFNALVSGLAGIIRKSPTWSGPLAELKGAVISTVIITDFQSPAVNAEIRLQGIGKTRNDINIFKQNLDKLAFYTGVKLTINPADIIKRDDIRFDVIMRIRNPEKLYAQ